MTPIYLLICAFICSMLHLWSLRSFLSLEWSVWVNLGAITSILFLLLIQSLRFVHFLDSLQFLHKKLVGYPFSGPTLLGTVISLMFLASHSFLISWPINPESPSTVTSGFSRSTNQTRSSLDLQLSQNQKICDYVINFCVYLWLFGINSNNEFIT